MSPRRVATLIVDDQDDIRLLLRLTIEAANDGLVVAGEAGDGLSALELVEALAPDVVVLDHMMPGMTGLHVARELRQRHPELPIVLFTAYLDADLEHAARAVGIDACLDKTQLSQVPATLGRVTEPAA